MREHIERQLSGFGNWVVTRAEEDYMQHFGEAAAETLVYLTADSPNEVHEVIHNLPHLPRLARLPAQQPRAPRRSTLLRCTREAQTLLRSHPGRFFLFRANVCTASRGAARCRVQLLRFKKSSQ
jgi:hypothetical protein